MADDILADDEQREMLVDMMQCMPPSRVDRVMGWRNGTCMAAIRSGRMRYIQLPGSSRMLVTPRFVTEFVDKHCTFLMPSCA